MLFNFEDYLNSNLIGKDTQCATCSDWGVMYTTAKQTRDAFFKAMNQWYLSATTCLTPNSVCYKSVVSLWSKFEMETIPQFNENMALFFESQSCNPTTPFNNLICDGYRESLTKLKCDIKQLLRLVDGDFGGAQTTTNT